MKAAAARQRMSMTGTGLDSGSSVASGSSSRLSDEPVQRPFSASSVATENLVSKDGVRLNRNKDLDVERGQQQHRQGMQQMYGHWDEIEDLLESIGLTASREDATSSLWWTALSSSADSDMSALSLDKSQKRRGPKTSKGRIKPIKQWRDPPRSLAERLQDVPISSSRHDVVLTGPSTAELNGHSHVRRPDIAALETADDGTQPIFTPPDTPDDDALALLLPLLVLLSTLFFLLLVFILLVLYVRRRARIALSDGDGPLDVGREEELEGMGGLDGVEERWLETVDEPTRRGYMRAKDWTLSYPPASLSSEITLSQFLSIQEKGVSAWSFDPDYESNPSVFVESRTELTFLADGEGMAPQEGGGCSVQSNLPLPKLNEVYYWEAKMFNKPDSTNVAIGLATKPFPGFRMPGWCKYSVGFFSADGFKCHNHPFAAQSYGPAYLQGDVIGVGYRPRSGTVFFTRNGKKLEDAYIGLNRYNLFPTIGADGAAEIHVNLGQAGFVFIEANVKKWGLAPMVGTLAPPPAYGMERGSILIESGQGTSNNMPDSHRIAQTANSRLRASLQGRVTPPPPLTPPNEVIEDGSDDAATPRPNRAHRSARTLQVPLPTTASAALHDAHLVEIDGPDDDDDDHSSPRRYSISSTDDPHNPPTPHHLDISMHSLDGTVGGGHSGSSSTCNSSSPATLRAQQRLPPVNISNYFPNLIGGNNRTPSPPPYSAAWNEGALGGTDAHTQARRSSGRTHSIANALFGALADRGLLTPLSAQGDTGSDGTSNNRATFDDYERQTIVETDHGQSSRGGGGGGNSSERGWLSSWFR